MIRGNVGDGGNIRAKIHNGFQLKGTDLTNGGGLLFCLQCLCRKGISDISHHMGITVFAFQNLPDKTYRSGLSVGSRYCAKLSLAGLVGQFDFSDNRDLGGGKHFHIRLI